jgi:small-conductance mechanosensitive channel
VDAANAVLRKAVEALQQDESIKPLLLGEPTYQGVVGLGDQFFTLRVLVRTKALEQWTVQYALDRLVKNHFAAAGIEMPRQAVQLYTDEAAGNGESTLPVVGPVR